MKNPIEDMIKLIDFDPEEFCLEGIILDLENESLNAHGYFPKTAAFFIGHFPDEPVVPGVILLDNLIILSKAYYLKAGWHFDQWKIINCRFVGKVYCESISFRLNVKKKTEKKKLLSGSVFMGKRRCLQVSFETTTIVDPII